MEDQPDEKDPYPSRKHPYRLPRSAYRERDVPMLITIRIRDALPFLLGRGIPDRLLRTMEMSTERHGCAVIAYTIMPEHVHFVACVSERGGDLVGFIERFKRQTARELGEMGVPRPVWQRSFHDETAFNEDALAAMVEYVLTNASRRRLCRRPEDWPWAGFHGYPWDAAPWDVALGGEDETTP